MAYCGPRGIPHWYFLGGPNRWTAHDRAAALGWLLHERQRCQSCGTRPDEWDPDKGGDEHAYQAAFRLCRGCEVRAGGEEDLASADRDGRVRRGTTVTLQRPEVPGGGDRVDQGSRPGPVQAPREAPS